jgi:starch synthase
LKIEIKYKFAMKVVLSTIGKFHTFDLARELVKRKVLYEIHTGYPGFKLKNEDVPQSLIHTYPYFHTPYMGFPFWEVIGDRVKQQWEYWDKISFDRHVAKTIADCDVFMGLSGSALETARVVKARGGVYICDRGSSHIRMQDKILREEHERWGIPYCPIDPRIIDREEEEYNLADAITVPSSFVHDTFLKYGISREKLNTVPYGVNTEKFQKTASPDPTGFNILFVGAVSLRKGIPDLLEAFARLEHPQKTLTLAGSYSPKLIDWLKCKGLWSPNLIVSGHVPQENLKDLMSRSHVMVLPSVEEGLAMVQAQAMACGCPVVATSNTGAQNLFTDGVEGFIVPIRKPEAIAASLQLLADQPERREKMSQAALARVRRVGGWSSYGDKVVGLMTDLCRQSIFNLV